MINDIKLTSAMRHSLLSHQQVKSLTSTVEKRLATGKKVSEILDGPATYFKAKGLYDGAADLLKRKQGIDQGISTIKVAQNGIEAGRTLIEQIKGLAEEARNASPEQRAYLQKQASQLIVQLDNILQDSHKDGVNLLSGDGRLYGPELIQNGHFEEGNTNGWTDTFAAVSDVADIDGMRGMRITVPSLVGAYSKTLSNNLGLTTGEDYLVSYSAYKSSVNPGAGVLNDQVSSQLNTSTGDGLGNAPIGFDQWSNVSITREASGAPATTDALALAPIRRASTHTGQAYFTNISVRHVDTDSTYEDTLTIDLSDDTQYTINSVDLRSNAIGLTSGTLNFSGSGLDSTIANIENALSTYDATAATFATDFALLQTRLGFTEDFVNVREEAGDKLTLADLEEESANLLALQTRNQLTLNSMSSSARSLQGILSLLQGGGL